MRNKVSVPSFGDSFFIKNMLEDEAISLEKVFPSPYSGILFLYAENSKAEAHVKDGVSVPSFGDSFFIGSGNADRI